MNCYQAEKLQKKKKCPVNRIKQLREITNNIMSGYVTGNKLLCLGLKAEIKNLFTKKKSHILVFSYFMVKVLESYGEGLDNLQNKLVLTPCI